MRNKPNLVDDQNLYLGFELRATLATITFLPPKIIMVFKSNETLMPDILDPSKTSTFSSNLFELTSNKLMNPPQPIIT